MCKWYSNMYSIQASNLATLPMMSLLVGSESAMYAVYEVFAKGTSDLDSSKPVQMVEKKVEQANKKKSHRRGKEVDTVCGCDLAFPECRENRVLEN